MREKDKDLNGFIVAPICLYTIKNTLCCNSNYLAVFNTMLNYIIIVITIIMLLRVIIKRAFHLKINVRGFAAVALIALFWFVTFVLNRKILLYEDILDDLVSFLGYSFFPLLIIPSLDSLDGIKKELYKWADVMCVAAVVGFILFYVNGAKDANGLSYSMTYGKNVVFPCMLMILKYKDERKIKDLTLAILLTIFILIIGSRFPLLYIMIYVFMLMFFDMGKIMRVVGSVVLCMVGYMILTNDFTLVIEIVSLMPGVDVSSSRTFSMLKSGVIFSDSNRDALHNLLIEGVKGSPIWGYGAGGGVYVLQGELPHGFIYDCIASLGYVLGGIFIAITFGKIIITWVNNRTNVIGNLTLLFSCMFFPTIFLQDSLFGAYKFWWLIAIAMFADKHKKMEKCYGKSKETIV